MRMLYAAGARSTFAYDGDGLLRRQEDPTSSAKLIWDEQNLLQSTSLADVTQAQYTLDPAGYGNVLSRKAGAQKRFFFVSTRRPPSQNPASLSSPRKAPYHCHMYQDNTASTTPLGHEIGDK